MHLLHPVSGKDKDHEPDHENDIIDECAKQQKTTPDIKIHEDSPRGAADALKNNRSC